jgi:hypothetical protein
MWGWMKSEVYKRKVDTRVKFIARILDATAGMKKGEDQLRQTTHDLAQEVQSALRLMVGFSNIYCEM